MTSKKVHDDKQYVAIGRRHGSADLQTEASEVSARWGRDYATLKTFGSGAAAKARFEALRREHTGLLTSRPDGIAKKSTVIGARDQATRQAWLWVDRGVLVLADLARSNSEVSHALAAARPDDDGDLPIAIPALAKLLATHQAELPDDSEVQARIDEAPALAQALTDAPGEVAAAKSAPIVDTAEIDLLDGKLYVALSALNEAGKRAIQHGELSVPRSDYKLKHLSSGGPKQPKAPVPIP